MTNPEYAASDGVEPLALIVPRVNWALNYLKVMLWPKVNKNQTKSPKNQKRTLHPQKPLQWTLSVLCKKPPPLFPAVKNPFDREQLFNDE
jgi:hypothetical protein